MEFELLQGWQTSSDQHTRLVQADMCVTHIQAGQLWPIASEEQGENLAVGELDTIDIVVHCPTKLSASGQKGGHAAS